jgi:hypothetical protein
VRKLVFELNYPYSYYHHALRPLVSYATVSAYRRHTSHCTMRARTRHSIGNSLQKKTFDINFSLLARCWRHRRCGRSVFWMITPYSECDSNITDSEFVVEFTEELRMNSENEMISTMFFMTGVFAIAHILLKLWTILVQLFSL